MTLILPRAPERYDAEHERTRNRLIEEADALYIKSDRDGQINGALTAKLLDNGGAWINSAMLTAGDGTTDDRTNLAALDARATAQGLPLAITRDHRIAADLTLTAPLIISGGSLVPDSGVTVTIPEFAIEPPCLYGLLDRTSGGDFTISKLRRRMTPYDFGVEDNVLSTTALQAFLDELKSNVTLAFDITCDTLVDDVLDATLDPSLVIGGFPSVRREITGYMRLKWSSTANTANTYGLTLNNWRHTNFSGGIELWARNGSSTGPGHFLRNGILATNVRNTSIKKLKIHGVDGWGVVSESGSLADGDNNNGLYVENYEFDLCGGNRSKAYTFVSSSGAENSTTHTSTITVDLDDEDTRQQAAGLFRSVDSVTSEVRYHTLSSYDAATNTAVLAPGFPSTWNHAASGTWVSGGGADVVGGDSGQHRWGTINGLRSGIGYRSRSLYGGTIGGLMIEGSGIGFSGGIWPSTSGTGDFIAHSHMEANTSDVVQCSSSAMVELKYAHLTATKVFSVLVPSQNQNNVGNPASGTQRIILSGPAGAGETFGVYNPHGARVVESTGNFDVRFGPIVIESNGSASAKTLTLYRQGHQDLTKQLVRDVTILDTAGAITLAAEAGYTVNGAASIALGAVPDHTRIRAALLGTDWQVTIEYPVLTGSATWDAPSLASGAEQTTTVTVTGAKLGDQVTGVSLAVSLAGTTLVGYVSATDTVTVVHRNGTGGAVDLASSTLRATVSKRVR